MSFAHSPNKFGHPQLLVEHSRNVGGLTARFCAPFVSALVGRLVGELHDAGKCGCSWQKKLAMVGGSGKRIGIDHKTLACDLVEQLEADLDLLLVLHGHHGGLTSHREIRDSRAAVDASILAEGHAAVSELVSQLGGWEWGRGLRLPWGEPRVREMGLRLLYSALVDADALDTRAHELGLSEPQVRGDADWAALWTRFRRGHAEFVAKRRPSPMDPVRDAVYAACVRAAEERPGFFRLAAVTGAGKTFAVGGFAVRHAMLHRKRRVVVALPWKTVTEQNSQAYRKLLDAASDPVVLEHHSGFNPDGHRTSPAGDEYDRDRQAEPEDAVPWEKTAMENWDAPFIVTTTVRLFESLFGRSRTATARLHRLADSVIVIDEVQGLPYNVLEPILDGLRILVEHFGATVVLCSATQPAFEALEPFKNLECKDIEVADPAIVTVAERRVRIEYQPAERRTLLDVAEDASAPESVLMVLNTTKDAAKVAAHWRRLHDEADEVFHLSARMGPAHRQRFIDEVKRRLDRGMPTKLVATQLIEAGVDLDFPLGYRACCGVDSAVQAAGRVNRSAQLPGPARLVVFDAVDIKPLRSLETAAELAFDLFWSTGVDPFEPAQQRRYWRKLYRRLGVDGDESAGAYVQRARADLDYTAVVEGTLLDRKTGARDRTKRFRMIDADPVAVIIPHTALEGQIVTPSCQDGADLGAGPELIQRARTSGEAAAALRDLQPFMASLHAAIARRPDVLPLLDPVLGKPGDPGSVAVWRGDYDRLTGMVIDPELEDFIL